MKRIKLPAVPFVYREIKRINIAAFQASLTSSSLLSSSATTADEYLYEIENVVTKLLDSVAPLRTSTRSRGRTGSKELSPEARDEIKTRRQLERRWKTDSEADQLAYRANCIQTNRLINTSRSKLRSDRISSAEGNPRRVWAEVKNMLYSSPPSDFKTSEEC